MEAEHLPLVAVDQRRGTMSWPEVYLGFRVALPEAGLVNQRRP